MPKRKKGKPLLAGIVLVALGFLLLTTDLEMMSPSGGAVLSKETGDLKIASWNLQVFGQSKASNDTLMGRYVDIMNNYDIIIIQEIRDTSQESYEELCSLMVNYSCVISERTGRSSSKEQYGIFYKDVELLSTKDYFDMQRLWERPPFSATFKKKKWTFTLLTLHSKPDDTPVELDNLDDLANSIEGDVVVLGDLNADCNYYNGEPETFVSWTWAIGDGIDTTVSSTNCAYDRIIVNEKAENNLIKVGVNNKITGDLSDHYLVWGEFTSKIS